MSNLTIIVLFLINIDCMIQPNFTKAINELYFGVNMNNISVDSIIQDLQGSNKLKYLGVSNSQSLSDNFKLNTSNKIDRNTYSFQMLTSPVLDNEINSGCIKISIGKVKGENRLLNVEWGIELENEQFAQNCFDALTLLFISNSTNYSVETDEKIKYAKYAQFSNKRLKESEIRDIGFSLFKNISSGKFEIKLFHFNDFMK